MRINCDIGERGPGHAVDRRLMEVVHIANLACGGHAGDRASVQAFRALAEEHGVELAAHLSYPDRPNFGRRVLAMPLPALLASLDEQLALLPSPKRVKFHGALYNESCRSRELAAALGRLGDEEKAIYSFEKSLQAKPDFPDARQELLEILLTRGQYERVVREAERLPRSGPAAFAGHFLKGQALFGLRDFAAALDELLAANAIVNTDVNLINLIGRAFLELDDGEQASKAFTASLALKKNQPEIEKLLAEATAQGGKKGK